MPIPNTKLHLSPTVSGGGGFVLQASNGGDVLAPPLGGIVGPGSVGSVSDLNGDGLADLIFGAPGSNDKAVDAGRIFVTLGAAAPGSVQDVAHGTPGVFVIDGAHAGDMAGFSVGSVSDLNGDGLSEILIGAPGMAVGAANDAGAGFVIWGKAAGSSGTGRGTGVDLADPFSQAGGGYAIKGQAAGDLAGWAMTSVGDLNGDGRADVLIGAPGQDAGGADAGAAYVVWGKASNASVQLNTVAAGTGGFAIVGAAAGDAIGKVVAALGDQNGDGLGEIALGSATALGGAGSVWVVNGQASGSTVHLAALTGGYQIIGQAGDGAGSSVADIGDVNGDGRHDLLIGAAGANAAYVVYGQAGTGAIHLADVAAGVGGVAISAAPGADLSGMVVLGGADLNHDGIDDLVIGTPHDGEGGTDAGAVYVIWGDQLYRPIHLDEVAQGIGGAKIVGSAGSLAGGMLSLAGDVNGDGTVDLMIGTPGNGAGVKVLYTPATWGPDDNIYGSAGADLIGVGYGNAYHMVGAGNDAILGLGGDDTINGAAGDDVIEGGSGNDLLLGGAGNDLLDGGLGTDGLSGGAGDDTYVVDGVGDVIREQAPNGIDTVRASASYGLGANVENLILTGLAANGTGNGLANVITGNAAANVLDGGAGDDTLAGGAGDDTYVVSGAGDLIVEAVAGGFDTVVAAINWTLGANLEGLVLTGAALQGTGNAADNALTGTDGNNILNGKAGADTMAGGAGDDTYVVDSAADQVIEAVAGGYDTVRSSVDFVLGAGVEALSLTGAARHGTGNDLDNAIKGSGFADVLDGGAGVDLLTGGAGDDLYIMDRIGDRAVEGKTGGIDTVRALVDWTLTANLENLELAGLAHVGTGNALANHLLGTGLSDTLNGAAGADTMAGGAGDDTYVVDSAGDVVVEDAATSGGRDTVLSSISLTLTDGVENLTLTRAGLTGTGTAGDNLLTGSAGGDSLVGLGGNDTLDGAGGADTMAGGAGDDTYVLDNLGDTIVEGLDGGHDVAVLMVDGLTVSGDIEVIRLGGSAHSATGDGADNILEGGSGHDTLDGGAGNDVLLAGDGNDVLNATSGHDNLSGGSGDDVYHIHGAAVDLEDFLGHDRIDASDGTADQHIDLSGETESEIEHEHCHITPGGNSAAPLDVQFLQDLTGSFADDIATVRGLVPQIVAAVQGIQADSTFGLSSFVDKPVSPFGVAGEWVYQQEQALSADGATLQATYAGITTHSGSDTPEAQLEALMQLALHAAEVGYRPDSARFVVLFTDAPFHVAGDGAAGGITTANNGDGLTPGNGAFEDYPLIAQVQAALIAANIIPIFAIAGGFEATYQGLVDSLGRGTVVSLTANSSNIVAAITGGLTEATTTHIEDCDAGSGNDTVIGGIEDNALAGNDGDDNLDGRAGDDHLIGGAGADILTGGAGQDSLLGGDGADHFIFALTTDSAAGAADVIGDFATGLDVIDLSGIDADTVTDGDQAFVFIDAAAFGLVAGQLRLVDNGAGMAELSGDVDGDGIADFAVLFVLSGGMAPVLADMIL